MEMTDQWAKELASNGIKFEQTEEKIIFYDPIEKNGTVVIREHIKAEQGEYISRRVGEMSHESFNKKFSIV